MFGISRKPFKKKRNHFRILPDDTFLVAYPKSGITWVRFLIGNYTSGNQCGFENSHLIVPDIHYNLEYCSSMKAPRIIKSHMQYTAEYPRVIYLVRDGRDVAVSYYYHLKKYHGIDINTGFSEFMQKFNRGEAGGFGLWSRHVTSWLDGNCRDMLVIRFEDMKDDIEYWFGKILSFCGFTVDRKKLLDAIEHASLEKMKSSETSQYESNELFAGSVKSIPFVRKGEKDQWKKYFNEEMLSEFNKANGSTMRKMNYVDGI